MIHLNQAMNIIIGNFAYASYVCMRNGILGISLFVLIMLGTYR